MIIGITGTNGAGKGTVVEYLVQKHGFTHYSVRDFLSEEIARRGLVKNRGTMLMVANELRAQHGPGFIAEQLLAGALAAGGDAVVESIRSIGEAQYLQTHGALLWAVDAALPVRYERILGRMSETDKISYEKFVEDEQAEIANSEATKPNLRAVIGRSDAVFTNDGDPAALYQQVEVALEEARG